MSTKKSSTRRTRRKPRILVLDDNWSAGARYVTRQGGIAVTVSPYDIGDVEDVVREPFDGLLLMGGGDVDPDLYGEKPHKRTYGISVARDYTEWIALDAAVDYGAAVLGICRGSQLIAVHNGGRLKQHINGHRGNDHIVLTEIGTRFRSIIGQAGMFRSLHHQVVVRTGRGFRVAARDRLGGIEAIESTDGRVLGVQFHPEMDYFKNPSSRAIFEWFVQESARRAGLVVPKPESEPKPEKPSKALVLAERKPKRNLAVRYFCRDCGMEFDERHDRDDHEVWIHGDPVIAVRSRGTVEPPAGHPDWMPKDPKDRELWIQGSLDEDSDYLG